MKKKKTCSVVLTILCGFFISLSAIFFGLYEDHMNNSQYIAISASLREIGNDSLAKVYSNAGLMLVNEKLGEYDFLNLIDYSLKNYKTSKIFLKLFYLFLFLSIIFFILNLVIEYNLYIKRKNNLHPPNDSS